MSPVFSGFGLILPLLLFGKKFQKKVNETIKPKEKTKKLLKEYTSKSTPAKWAYHYGSRQPIRQSLCPSSSGRGHHSYQSQGFVPRHGQRKFYFRGGRGKSESIE